MKGEHGGGHLEVTLVVDMQRGHVPQAQPRIDDVEAFSVMVLNEGSEETRADTLPSHLRVDECQAAAGLYTRWNEDLYRLMHSTQSTAPVGQPVFERFPDPCKA